MSDLIGRIYAGFRAELAAGNVLKAYDQLMKSKEKLGRLPMEPSFFSTMRDCLPCFGLTPLETRAANWMLFAPEPMMMEFESDESLNRLWQETSYRDPHAQEPFFFLNSEEEGRTTWEQSASLRPLLDGHLPEWHAQVEARLRSPGDLVLSNIIWDFAAFVRWERWDAVEFILTTVWQRILEQQAQEPQTGKWNRWLLLPEYGRMIDLLSRWMRVRITAEYPHHVRSLASEAEHIWHDTFAAGKAYDIRRPDVGASVDEVLVAFLFVMYRESGYWSDDYVIDLCTNLKLDCLRYAGTRRRIYTENIKQSPLPPHLMEAREAIIAKANKRLRR
jgi:hypothetical protein